MIGKDFLAKLLSRWIYSGLVLVDSGTFSLLSQFLFMTCHLLQQARSEPLASSSCSGCGSGMQRLHCREPRLLFRKALGPGRTPLPALAPRARGADRAWRGGKGQHRLRQRSWQLPALGDAVPEMRPRVYNEWQQSLQ